MRLDRRSFVASTLMSGGGARGAAAQTPIRNRAVRVIVPFPRGGTTDLLAPWSASACRPIGGQPFVVENVGGAGGSLGADRVAKAAPDGYTLLFHNLTFSTTSVSLDLAGRATHDMFRDFRPVSLAAHVPMIVLGRANGPQGTLADFVTAARQSGDPALYARRDRAAS